jgi:uncharacterized protein (DUF1697 family)
MLRAINLGSHNRIRMDELRALYGSLGLADARTYLQSGNVVFSTRERNLSSLRRHLEGAIEEKFGFHSDVIFRTAAELQQVVERNPFATRRAIDPARLLVTFLAADPGEPAREEVRRLKVGPEELHVVHRELYVYFPNGIGRSKLPSTAIGKALKVPGTARNWNSVTQLLRLATERDALS